MKASYLLYGLALGLLLALLQYFKYRLLVLDHARELYIGLIALLFTAVGIWAGSRLTRRKTPPSLPAVSSPDPARVEASGLSPREWEVLQLMAQGHSNQEIAERLFISLNTVKTHAANVFAKLGVERRGQAVQKGRELGLLE